MVQMVVAIINIFVGWQYYYWYYYYIKWLIKAVFSRDTVATDD